MFKNVYYTEEIKITKRRIKMEPVEGTRFFAYQDEREISVNGKPSTTVYSGITTEENIRKTEGLKDIQDRFHQDGMCENRALVAIINKRDFEDVLLCKQHILDVVEYHGNITYPCPEDCFYVLYNPGKYEIMDLNGQFIPIPVHMGYMDFAVNDGKYDLESLLEVLKADDRVIDRENLEIFEIPYYNARNGQRYSIEFDYLPSAEDYAKFASLPHYKDKEYLMSCIEGADACKRIEYEMELE